MGFDLPAQASCFEDGVFEPDVIEADTLLDEIGIHFDLAATTV